MRVAVLAVAIAACGSPIDAQDMAAVVDGAVRPDVMDGQEVQDMAQGDLVEIDIAAVDMSILTADGAQPADMTQPVDMAQCTVTAGTCCPGNKCAAGYTCVDNGCNACGALGQYCCGGGQATGGACASGICRSGSDPAYGVCVAPCGQLGQPCCPIGPLCDKGSCMGAGAGICGE